MGLGKPRFALITGLCVLAVVVSLLEGTPSRLPGVAMESALLLHLERAGAILAVVVVILSVAAQAARGRLPVELSTSGFRYAPEPAEDLRGALDKVQYECDELRNQMAEVIQRVE
jgi:hypothetical protein